MRQTRMERYRQREVRRRRGLALVAAALLTGMLAAGGFWVWGGSLPAWQSLLGGSDPSEGPSTSAPAAQPSSPALVTVTPPPAPPDPALEPYQPFLNAAKLVGEGRGAQALPLLETPPPAGYRLYLHHALRARAQLASDDRAAALREAEQAYSLAAGPERTDTGILLAELRYGQGDFRGTADLLVSLIPSGDLLFRGPDRSRLITLLEPTAQRLDMNDAGDRSRLMKIGELLFRYGLTSEGAALFLRTDWPEPAGVELKTQRIRSRAFLGETNKAISDLAVLAATAPPADAAYLHYLRAAYLTARDRPDEAKKAYAAAAAVGAGTYSGGMSVYRLVEPDLDADRVEKAAPLIRQHASAYGNTTGWQRGAWELFASAYATGQMSQARQALEMLRQVVPASAQYRYWRYRLAREAGGDAPDELALLLKEQPYQYYSLIVGEQWPEEASAFGAGSTDPAVTERLTTLRRLAMAGTDQDPVYDGIDLTLPLALWRSGHRDHAAGELRSLADTSDRWELRYLLALWEGERGQHRESIRLISLIAPKFGTPPPAPILEGLYPRFYRETVERAAAEHGVDPAFVFAIMREESAFEAGAHSSADARGLMQIIPSTATGLARQAGLTEFSQADLFRPEVAIPLGVRYLADLLKHFNGDTRLAAAAYNGGQGAVDRWVRITDPKDMALFVERIAYPETRNYVKKTDLSYRMYRLLYGTAR